MVGFTYGLLTVSGISGLDADFYSKKKHKVVRVNTSGDLAKIRNLEVSSSYQLVKSRDCKQNDLVSLVKEGRVSCHAGGRLKEKKYLSFFLPAKSSTAGWVYAVFTGDKSFLSFELKEFMRDFGLSHMCAVSGFHLAVVLVIILGFEKLIDLILLRTKISKTLGTILKFLLRWALILFWLNLIGFKASAVRATLCYFFSSCTPVKMDRFSNISILAGVFILLSPLDIYNFSALLSWSSYLLIIYVMRQKTRGGIVRVWLVKSFKIQTILGVMSLAVVGEVSIL
ncbi:ComEC/Rec2 family competence protein, partial [bacterium]|nr:ComEC/Rec2 family competence protein [bacterium]